MPNEIPKPFLVRLYKREKALITKLARSFKPEKSEAQVVRDALAIAYQQVARESLGYK